MWPLLLATTASAGGYFYSDSGIVATGRGGAFVASADTQFAQYYNPAGLIRIERPTLNLGASLVQQNVGFRRLRPDADPAEPGAFYPEVENRAAPFAVPQGGFVTPLGDDFALAVGFYSPFAPSSLYDEEGPQRYSIKDTLIFQFSVGPSLAWRPVEALTIGVGLQWNYLQVGEEIDVTVNGRDDPIGDVAVEANVVDRFTPSANLGLLVDPVPEVSIGASVQPATAYRGRGRGRLDFTGNGLEAALGDPVFTDEDVSLAIRLPWVIRGGVAVRPLESLEIEAAVVWQDWSALGDLVVDDIGINVLGTPVSERLELPSDFDDTVSWRLGAEWQAHRNVALRAGGFYEDGAVAPQDLSVALVDTAKFQIGAGASVLLADRVTIDVAAAYLAFASAEIRDSTVTQIGAFDSVEPLVVGNGDIRSSGWILGLQTQLALGSRSNDG